MEDLLEIMASLLEERQPEGSSVLLVLVAQYFIITQSDPTAVSLSEFSRLLSKLCSHTVRSHSTSGNSVVALKLLNLFNVR